MKKKWIAYPYIVWMTIFIVVPILLVFSYSITYKSDTGLQFTLENYKRFLDPLYINVLIRSFNLALISTVICLLLGYPIAMILAKSPISSRNLMLLLFIIPMWMNFLLRTYSWMALLERNGFINRFLKLIHLPTMNLMYTKEAVVIGMVYNFLPFMVLPIYSVLVKIDKSLIEAAEDLGAERKTIFLKIIFPLSLPGVISGITMVFMPAITTFVISRLLGGGQFTLIGNLIEDQFINVGDWSFGSAISIVLMIIMLISMRIMSKYDKDKEGVGLW